MSFIAEKAIRKSAPLGAFLSAFKSSQAEQMCFSTIAEMVFILYTHRGGDNGVRDLEWRKWLSIDHLHYPKDEEKTLVTSISFNST